MLGAITVAGLSLLPGSAVPAVGLWDKAEHALAYGALGLAAGLGWPDRRGVALAALVLLGGGLELGQGYVPGRASSLGDGVANTLGAALGLLAAGLPLRRGRNTAQRPGSD